MQASNEEIYRQRKEMEEAVDVGGAPPSRWHGLGKPAAHTLSPRLVSTIVATVLAQLPEQKDKSRSPRSGRTRLRSRSSAQRRRTPPSRTRHSRKSRSRSSERARRTPTPRRERLKRSGIPPTRRHERDAAERRQEHKTDRAQDDDPPHGEGALPQTRPTLTTGVGRQGRHTWRRHHGRPLHQKNPPPEPSCVT